jgi:hypothetical protein
VYREQSNFGLLLRTSGSSPRGVPAGQRTSLGSSMFVRITFQTHHEGSAGCGAFPREVAQAKAAQLTELAR